MIVSRQKPQDEILELLGDYQRIFLVGCGECAATCKSGGKDEVIAMQKVLKEKGKFITGTCVPEAPCIAAQAKAELAKNSKAIREAEAVLVLSCGLGVQSIKDNERVGLSVLPGCDTLFGAVTDGRGDFYEKCSMCGECVLGFTLGICPITLCPKGLLNGPCGGMNKGKCEVDKDKDCAWVLIYRELEKKKALANMRKIREPKDYKRSTRPRRLAVSAKAAV